jgi:hypothetical protein
MDDSIIIDNSRREHSQDSLMMAETAKNDKVLAQIYERGHETLYTPESKGSRTKKPVSPYDSNRLANNNRSQSTRLSGKRSSIQPK